MAVGLVLLTASIRAEFAYVANLVSGVSAFSIVKNGALKPVAGSPFPAGQGPFPWRWTLWVGSSTWLTVAIPTSWPTASQKTGRSKRPKLKARSRSYEASEGLAIQVGIVENQAFSLVTTLELQGICSTRCPNAGSSKSKSIESLAKYVKELLYKSVRARLGTRPAPDRMDTESLRRWAKRLTDQSTWKALGEQQTAWGDT